ncbi:uncharacterized protein [Littorina saxatilis]|uniref:uncharacterized protein n=1 Tax=Littorina saxatilis TaxID=31220 RepID=UPI0038B50741
MMVRSRQTTTATPPPTTTTTTSSARDNSNNVAKIHIPTNNIDNHHHHHQGCAKTHLGGTQPSAMFLPLHATLPNGCHVTVSTVTDYQVSEIFNLVQEAALRGEGYGVDEFPTEKDFLKEVQSENGKMFKICAQGSATGNPIAAFVIVDSKFYRGQGTVADSYIVVKREERMKGIGEFCMQMVMQISARLGYISIYCDTFKDNVAMRKIMDRAGFQRFGFLPMSARMPDGSLKQSLVYYRELESPVKHQSQIGERSSPNLQKNDSCSDFEDMSPS